MKSNSLNSRLLITLAFLIQLLGFEAVIFKSSRQPFGWRKLLENKLSAVAIAASSISVGIITLTVPISVNAVDNTFQDQLRVIQALQVEEQSSRVNDAINNKKKEGT